MIYLSIIIIKLRLLFVPFDWKIDLTIDVKIYRLKQSDFIITEDGAPQKVELFSAGENAALPRSIVLIYYHTHNSKSDFENNLEAAKSLVDNLAPGIKWRLRRPTGNSS